MADKLKIKGLKESYNQMISRRGALTRELSWLHEAILAEYSIGDRVKINAISFRLGGHTGTITEIKNTDVRVELDSPSNRELWVLSSNIDPI